MCDGLSVCFGLGDCSEDTSVCLLCSNALYLLVLVSQRLMFAMESGGAVMSHLDETLKKALICIKRLFDKLIVSVCVCPLRVCVCVCSL